MPRPRPVVVSGRSAVAVPPAGRDRRTTAAAGTAPVVADGDADGAAGPSAATDSWNVRPPLCRTAFVASSLTTSRASSASGRGPTPAARPRPSAGRADAVRVGREAHDDLTGPAAGRHGRSLARAARCRGAATGSTTTKCSLPHSRSRTEAGNRSTSRAYCERCAARAAALVRPAQRRAGDRQTSCSCSWGAGRGRLAGCGPWCDLDLDPGAGDRVRPSGSSGAPGQDQARHVVNGR